MQTIEKTIHKLRKLSHEFENTHNSTEMHSNTSFFDEERSQDFQDCDSSIGEEFSDSWEMSSICTENSIQHHRPTLEQLALIPGSQHFKSTPTSIAVRGTFADEEIGDVVKDVHNSSQSGKGIAIHVRGQGSTGLFTKKEKKANKITEKKLQIENNCDNNNNNWTQQSQQQPSQPQPQPQPQYPYQSYQGQQQQQQQKQVSQCSKIMLAYLMMEREVERSAELRASSFLEKYMPANGEAVKEMVKETYKIILIPEQILQQLAAVLNLEQKTLHLNLCLQRLHLQYNKHPLAAKAADKIRKHFGDCC